MNIDASTTHSVRSVVIVDDSGVQRSYAVGLCRKLGIDEVYDVPGGAELLDFLRANAIRPDVIVLDLEMPGLDGVATAEALQAADIAIPLVIASSRDLELIVSVSHLLDALGLCILDAVQKPLSLEALGEAFAKFER
jgi:CheY-like chemotaxis protein